MRKKAWAEEEKKLEKASMGRELRDDFLTSGIKKWIYPQSCLSTWLQRMPLYFMNVTLQRGEEEEEEEERTRVSAECWVQSERRLNSNTQRQTGLLLMYSSVIRLFGANHN